MKCTLSQGHDMMIFLSSKKIQMAVRTLICAAALMISAAFLPVGAIASAGSVLPIDSIFFIGSFLPAESIFSIGSFSAFAATVEYSDLQELLTAGNQDLKNNSFYSNLEDLEEQLAVLKQECQDMVALSKIYGDQQGTSDDYRKTAESLNRTINQLEKRYNNMTGTSASINTAIDMMTMSAQASMISYLKMENNAMIRAKEAEAAAVKYQNTLTRQAAGMALESESMEIHAQQLNAEAQAASYRQQADTLRRTLLQMLGLPDDGSVTFGTIPVPSAEELASLNYEADLEAAINNDSAVKNVRHRRSDSSTAMSLKASAEEEAVGNASADFLEAYTLVQTEIAEYDAAQKAFAAAQNEWQGAQRKQSAGILTKADALTAEAAWIRAQGELQSAAMELRTAYDQYRWIVKGVA